MLLVYITLRNFHNLLHILWLYYQHVHNTDDRRSTNMYWSCVNITSGFKKTCKFLHKLCEWGRLKNKGHNDIQYYELIFCYEKKELFKNDDDHSSGKSGCLVFLLFSFFLLTYFKLILLANTKHIITNIFVENPHSAPNTMHILKGFETIIISINDQKKVHGFLKTVS